MAIISVSDGSDEDIGEPLVQPLPRSTERKSSSPLEGRSASPDPLDTLSTSVRQSKPGRTTFSLTTVPDREMPRDGESTNRLAQKIKGKQRISSHGLVTDNEVREIIDITDDGAKQDTDRDSIESFGDDQHPPVSLARGNVAKIVNQFESATAAATRAPPHINLKDQPPPKRVIQQMKARKKVRRLVVPSCM